jgi:lysophospholipase L1-like esterase
VHWQTETLIPDFPFRIDHNSQQLSLGSCFAENIGKRLDYYKFNTILNPFGTVYNPLSLLQTVSVLGSEKKYTQHDLHFANGRFFSYDHHSRFSAASADEMLEKINQHLLEGRAKLPQTKVAFISLGTAYYWWLKDEGRVVNNCHKQPGDLFEQRLASVKEVRSALTEVVILLQKAAPEIDVVFTISPIRHLKHGSAGNQLSKATLIVAAQELAQGFENVHYFPSYELLLDDLRDYRWYEEDLVHPNKMAIDYIWEKFSAAFFNEPTRKILPQIDAIRKQLNHRPFVKSQAALQKIRAGMRSKAEALPGSISFDREVRDWSLKLGLEMP